MKVRMTKRVAVTFAEKIAYIRLSRELIGWGLREAKELAECVLSGGVHDMPLPFDQVLAQSILDALQLELVPGGHSALPCVDEQRLVAPPLPPMCPEKHDDRLGVIQLRDIHGDVVEELWSCQHKDCDYTVHPGDLMVWGAKNG